MKNLFQDAMYLFNMEIEQNTIFISENDPAYQLHVIPMFEYTYDDFLSFSDIPSSVKFELYLFKDKTLIETDDLSGDYVSSEFFFEYLRWFNHEPDVMIDSLYRQIKLKVIA
jgi:hypothetical protein